MRFFENARFDFIGNRKIGYFISASLILMSLLTISIRGFQYGIDFLGGTELVLSFETPVSVTDARSILNNALPTEPQVRVYGSDGELQIRTLETDIDFLSSTVQQAFLNTYPDNSVQIIKTDVIGPVFARDMREAAVLATIFSVLVISIYIFIRFQTVPFMVAVLAALLHDVIIILGLFTLFHGVLPFNMDIDQILIGAFLTIIGYSLNDTIVVFDRIRENSTLHKSGSWPELVNKSINQTLSRTVVTSLTTLIVVLVLFIFGGAVLKGFSFALILGIVLGTYSTIYLACPMLVDLRREKNPAPKLTTGLGLNGNRLKKIGAKGISLH